MQQPELDGLTPPLAVPSEGSLPVAVAASGDALRPSRGELTVLTFLFLKRNRD